MEINWLGFILAGLVPTIVGFLFYNPATFQKAWMDSIGMTEEKMQGANLGKIMGLSILMSFVLAFFMMGFCNGAGQEGEFDTFKHGAAHGGILTGFVVFPILLIKSLYDQVSFKNVRISTLYWGITLALMGGVVDHFHHWG